MNYELSRNFKYSLPVLLINLSCHSWGVFTNWTNPWSFIYYNYCCLSADADDIQPHNSLLNLFKCRLILVVPVKFSLCHHGWFSSNLMDKRLMLCVTTFYRVKNPIMLGNMFESFVDVAGKVSRYQSVKTTCRLKKQIINSKFLNCDY